MPSTCRHCPRLLSLVVTGLALVGPAGPTGCANTTTSDRSLTFVDPSEAQAIVADPGGLLKLGKQEGAAWVDPRPAAAFAEGHIPGAINMPLERVSTAYTAVEKLRTVIVYGKAYNDPIAEAMSKRLIGLGLKDVRTLRGGLQAWKEAGMEMEEGPAR